MEPILIRKQALLTWLAKRCQLSDFSCEPLCGDASFRRYFRILTNGPSYIAMDAPTSENIDSFVLIADALRDHGLKTPTIYHADLSQGFLLLSDFGDHTFLKTLTLENADCLYGKALEALSHLQACRMPLPLFTAERMWQEWDGFCEWFVFKLLSQPIPPLKKCFELLVQSALSQPQVTMHRDFHSANLMWIDQQAVGILDFQDAFLGPVTYDLVSLLRDCYIDWPDQKVQCWVNDYQQKLIAAGVIAPAEQVHFTQWFDWMGIERHLKALFTFARKYVRDQDARYLAHIPRTLTYLVDISSRYPILSPLHDYLILTLCPAFKQGVLCAP